jgi:hypothetical protein
VLSVSRNSPLERGASSTLYKRMEEAGCVARGYAVRLDKMLKLVAFRACPLVVCSTFVLLLFSIILRIDSKVESGKVVKWKVVKN